MTKTRFFGRAIAGTALAAAIAALPLAATTAPAVAQPAATAPSDDVTLSVGTGQMVRLSGTMSDLFVANDAIADVQVRSANQIYIFGKAAGQTTVYATNRAGQVIYSANVRVGNNLASVDQFLSIAMPEAQIRATPMNGMVLLTGTVATPADIEEAQHLVQAFVGDGTQVLSRLRSATPLQVMLRVKIAEVSRTLVRDIGVNLDSIDRSGGRTGFVVGRGRDFGEFNETGGYTFERPADGGTMLGLRLSDVFGVDIAGALDLAETSGLVTTLAEPTLTALSGETAHFLAGGEFPIPSAQGLGGTAIEFKQFGVGLAFTPTVLEGGRISMRIRPEVSELSAAGEIRVAGIAVPSLTTRRVETTVELGSGQSYMIAGLMQNNNRNSIERAPFLGNLPIIGALFRSNGFRRNETELVVVVTPYLVRPANAHEMALPTDGYRVSGEAERVLLDQGHAGRSGEQRPSPQMAPPQTVAPGFTGAAPALPAPVQPAPERHAAAVRPEAAASPAPGFDFQ